MICIILPADFDNTPLFPIYPLQFATKTEKIEEGRRKGKKARCPFCESNNRKRR